jgi:hypothetical protein
MTVTATNPTPTVLCERAVTHEYCPGCAEPYAPDTQTGAGRAVMEKIFDLSGCARGRNIRGGARCPTSWCAG